MQDILVTTDAAPFKGAIVEMYCFKAGYRAEHGGEAEYLDMLLNDERINRYGIRHPDDDWDVPATICKITFQVNRYGILFTTGNFPPVDVPKGQFYDEVDIDDEWFRVKELKSIKEIYKILGLKVKPDGKNS